MNGCQPAFSKVTNEFAVGSHRGHPRKHLDGKGGEIATSVSEVIVELRSRHAVPEVADQDCERQWTCQEEVEVAAKVTRVVAQSARDCSGEREPGFRVLDRLPCLALQLVCTR